MKKDMSKCLDQLDVGWSNRRMGGSQISGVRRYPVFPVSSETLACPVRVGIAEQDSRFQVPFDSSRLTIGTIGPERMMIGPYN